METLDERIALAYARLSDEDKNMTFEQIITKIQTVTGIPKLQIRTSVDDFIMAEVGDILRVNDLK